MPRRTSGLAACSEHVTGNPEADELDEDRLISAGGIVAVKWRYPDKCRELRILHPRFTSPKTPFEPSRLTAAAR